MIKNKLLLLNINNYFFFIKQTDWQFFINLLLIIFNFFIKIVVQLNYKIAVQHFNLKKKNTDEKINYQRNL
jgi:hypothetical protein